MTELSGAPVLIQRFEYPKDCVYHPDSYKTEFLAVAFVEGGGFEIVQGRERWTYSPGDVIVSIPGLKRRYRHFHECPLDVCLGVSFAPDSVEDALGRLPGRPLPPKLPAGTVSDFAFRWLTNALDSSDPMAIESAAFHCALVLGPHSWERIPRLSGAGSHARTIRRACTSMIERLEESHSLSSLARESRMSPFHFARVFSDLVGEPPHQYLLRARLSRAAKMLRHGASVTQAASLSGFLNTSHFSRTFHRRYGVPPIRYCS
jgi:AraC-like DNA-binding protein